MRLSTHSAICEYSKKTHQDLYLLTLINVEMDANNRRLPTYTCTGGFADMNKDH